MMDFMDQKVKESELEKKEQEYKQLKEQTKLDFLTRVYNRETLEKQINRYLKDLKEEEPNKEVIERIAKSLGECLKKTYEKDGKQVTISASIGIALCQKGDRFERLYKKADIALYQTKENGKNGYTFYKEAE